MTYDIYVNGEYETELYFIDDVVDYINIYCEED